MKLICPKCLKVLPQIGNEILSAGDQVECGLCSLRFVKWLRRVMRGDIRKFNRPRRLLAVKGVTNFQNIATKIVEAIEPKTKNHGEIQGIVHAFYKETKPAKLVVRELCTRNLVDCYFDDRLYDGVIALLKDKDGIIFMEGEISETENGEISEMRVSDFTPAPEFDEKLFESQIGKFNNVLTGKMDASDALDEYRS